MAGQIVGVYDEHDRLKDYAGVTFTYTPNGELATRADASGTTTYTYGRLGNLTGVVLPAGRTIDYIVDAQGRRIGKKGDGALIRGWLYADQQRVVAELDGSGAVVSRFLYGSRTNAPDYMVRSGVTYRFLHDHLGSVRVVLNTATGAVVQMVGYDEFGNVLSDTAPGFQPFGFAGGLYDGDTKLVRFGARDYDPYVGRFTTKDPVGFAGGDTNLYAYVLNDPVNLIDPMGTDWLEAAADFSAGAGSALTFGLTDMINEATGASAVIDKCSGWYSAGEWSGVALSTAIGANGLPAGLKHLSRSARGAIGEGLSVAENTLKGSKLLGTQVPGKSLGLSTRFDSVWRSAKGELYSVESKFGTSKLTRARRAAANALGDAYRVERWGYPFFGRVGGYSGFGYGAGGAMAGGGCGCD